jgi:hypothetical protein
LLPAADGTSQPYENEDVIRATAAVYEMVLDGSDVGLEAMAIDGLARLSSSELLLSFAGPVELGALGTVDGSDIVKFTATSLGKETAGSFSLWFDGADVGLDTPDEDIDAIEMRGDLLYLSTLGDYEVPGQVGTGADIFACAPASLGADTSCGTFSRPFSGRAAGFTGSAEGLDAFTFDPVDREPRPNSRGNEIQIAESRSLFSFAGGWSGRSASGGPADIGMCLYPKVVEAPDAPPPRASGLEDCGRDKGVALVVGFPAKPHALAENVAALELDY